jgi:hypothetical protein
MWYFIFFVILIFFIDSLNDNHKKTKSQKFDFDSFEDDEEEIDPLKAKGDEYERFVGSQFESKGELVIYNGFIRGFKDKGVDIITISKKNKTIILIQCKNWINKSMYLEDIVNIYDKLDSYDLDYFHLNPSRIQKYLQIHKETKEIEDIIQDSKNYQILKVLYVASDKVMDMKIGEHLKMLKQNIFRYKDMKIVIKRK